MLLLEEVGERPYRIDRQLTQLRLAGALERLAGVVVGDFVGCAEKDGSAPDAEAVIAERLGGRGIPILAGAPVGHGERNRARPARRAGSRRRRRRHRRFLEGAGHVVDATAQRSGRAAMNGRLVAAESR